MNFSKSVSAVLLFSTICFNSQQLKWLTKLPFVFTKRNTIISNNNLLYYFCLLVLLHLPVMSEETAIVKLNTLVIKIVLKLINTKSHISLRKQVETVSNLHLKSPFNNLTIKGDYDNFDTEFQKNSGKNIACIAAGHVCLRRRLEKI